MSVKSSEITKRHFDQTAEDYDNSHDGKFVQCMYDEIIARTMGQKGDRILDLGCGNGNIIRLLEERKKAEYYGLDLSESMIEQARKRVSCKVKLKTGDVVQMPYPDEFFDIIICNASFHHYNKPMKAVEEIRRVLKPGGVLVLGEPTFLSPLLPIVNAMMPLSNSGDYKLYSKKSIMALLEGNGFTTERWRRINYRTFVINARKEA